MAVSKTRGNEKRLFLLKLQWHQSNTIFREREKKDYKISITAAAFWLFPIPGRFLLWEIK